MITTSKQKERICVGCRLPKPKGEFIKGSSRCRECRRQYHRIYKQLRRQGRPRQFREALLEKEIETWEQVESIIREMAESQFKIQKEYAALEKRIALLKKYTNEMIESMLLHQINFQSMLKAFLKKTCPKGQAVTRRFDFGILRFYRGKLDVDLDAAYAGERMDKP